MLKKDTDFNEILSSQVARPAHSAEVSSLLHQPQEEFAHCIQVQTAHPCEGMASALVQQYSRCFYILKIIWNS